MAGTQPVAARGQASAPLAGAGTADLDALARAVAARVAELVGQPRRGALSVAEACAYLGVGWDFWREHVEPDVRVVRRGRRKLVAVVELERWLDANASKPSTTGTSPRTSAEIPANRGVRATRAPAREAA